ncbi:hypothetical protein Nepgr_005937 [Nepenthes gracilis]|uniref:Uncharacterized protein n=1 Tax=Nepenthes gracilis TaxID=150966 RepID=A0AAD3S483_NEPGR|nr:hypothetical protein Nepgr_005937 [Nepenthes gracilis]
MDKKSTIEVTEDLKKGIELMKSVSDKSLDLLRPSARYFSLFKGEKKDTPDHEKGKYSLVRNAEDFQVGIYDKPLPCFGCGVGWFSFLLGFVFPLAWYYATILYFGNCYRKDPRERAGLAASAIAAMACTVVLLIILLANIIVGSHVWIEDPELAWIDGEITRINGREIHVQISTEKSVVTDISKTYPKDTEAPPGGVDDMTKLAYLHEPGVLHNLATRYELNEIYTYTGNILIAVNPFQRLPHLYDTHMMEQYKGAAFGELSPQSLQAMMNEGKSNSILVRGESGAGKTETTKMLMRYLAYLGGQSGVEGHTVEQKVLKSNPVLEAFGNAKTVRNNNSSRFGKFVEIQFDRNGKISGAAIRTYLLERSRVCQVSDPERNYHCFYLLCAAPPEVREKHKLGSSESFHYLNQSKCYKLDGVDDGQEYIATRRAMDVVGISEEDQEAIFRVVAVVLHLGNIEFAKVQEVYSSVIKDEKSGFHLNTTAELLVCDAKSLEDALVKRVMVTPEEVITRTLDPVTAAIGRDALAKTIYSRLFDWLVDKINISIEQDLHSKSIIGVLDVYDFESFKFNSFEQFCINFTNEKLQQHFNQHVFKMEQEYTAEEINCSYVEFVDNQDVLDLIEKASHHTVA